MLLIYFTMAIILMWFYYEKKFTIFLVVPERNFYYMKKTTLYEVLEHKKHKINFKAMWTYYGGTKR